MRPNWSATHFAVNRPGLFSATLATVVLAVAALAVLPTLLPQALPGLAPIRVDTDPENMLSHEEPVRLFHDEMKETLALHDMIVVGVVQENHPQGVFNVATLRDVHALAAFAATLRGEAIGLEDPRAGVVEVDLLAPSTVDSMEPGGVGVVRFEWLMANPPASDDEALRVRDRALRLPFLNGTLVSEDGKALALYIPITAKDLSYTVSRRLQERIATFEGGAEYHITGLPVAEDTFGVEMFVQMAISAPLAMLVIFLLMLLFFRRLALIVSPLLVALATVIITMGLLVITGNTIHIMSSMIPIFIMPISVLDSVHILSEFFDRYPQTRDRRKTIESVMHHLFTPMLYTSLTSAAGFASLAITPIPPVQVFGIFVATGVMLAWFLTITFIPAFVMLLPESTLRGFGAAHGPDAAAPRGPLQRLLNLAGRVSYHQAKPVLAVALLLVAVAGYGITRIQINDNPIKWFHGGHPIRVADRVLNEHFGGTYMAYLNLRADGPPASAQRVANEIVTQAAASLPGPVAEAFADAAQQAAAGAADHVALLDDLAAFTATQADAAPDDDTIFAWEDAARLVDVARERDAVFKQPEALAYILDLQEHLRGTGVVGKSNSIADIVRTVHRELFEGAAEAYRVPDSARAVAQCLITYEGSHRPHDLWHFVTPDFRQASLWVQLTSGDNKDMSAVADSVAAYIARNPPPVPMEAAWFGLTYINVVWQEKMVAGMLEAFLGSFLVVLLMMTIMFGSGLWAAIAMIPLTLTIGLIYGVIGLIGKDYDMPVAVLSSLTLGLAVDFAIHYLARARELHQPGATWLGTSTTMSGEPARAIARNVIVIAVGFLPLLLAPLVPYQTVGVFLAAILLASGAATLLILPALIRLLEPVLFPRSLPVARACRLGTGILIGLTAYAAVWVNAEQFLRWGAAPWLTGLAVLGPLWCVGTLLATRRAACRLHVPKP